jgi:lipid II:glycine glycyltransferase (peptidoglycan interpeptide bridge formation enzyme)
MPNNLLAWEMMRYGQKIGCTKLDLWGSLGPEADPKDPWYGFHRFKKGFGGSHEQFIGTYDLVRDPFGYRMFTVADRVRWQYLKIKAMLPIGR